MEGRGHTRGAEAAKMKSSLIPLPLQFCSPVLFLIPLPAPLGRPLGSHAACLSKTTKSAQNESPGLNFTTSSSPTTTVSVTIVGRPITSFRENTTTKHSNTGQ